MTTPTDLWCCLDGYGIPNQRRKRGGESGESQVWAGCKLQNGRDLGGVDGLVSLPVAGDRVTRRGYEQAPEGEGVACACTKNTRAVCLWRPW